MFHNFFIVTFTLIVLAVFRFESAAFTHALQIALVGAIISWKWPHHKRLILFFVSIFGLFFIFKPIEAVALLVLSGFAVGLCLIPVSLRARVFLLITFGICLLAWRHWSVWSLAHIVVPLIGSVFMLRAWTYLRAVQKNPNLREWKTALSYFFLIPNFAVLFFPLLDYEIYARKSKDHSLALQNGTHWILIGLLHLLSYRLLRITFGTNFEDVGSYGDLFRFLILNFLLYLQVSGAFHLILGSISLYGFQIPRGNNFYLFSSSFSDFFRRINIYWKDFLVQTFYIPVYFRLRGLGHTTGLILATLLTFFISYLLHVYIYYWTRNELLPHAGEFWFWSTLGVLVSINTWMEDKSAKKKPVFHFSKVAIQITLCLIVICFLWAIKTVDSAADFISALFLLQWRGFADLAWLLIFPAIGIAGAIHRRWLSREFYASRFVTLGFILLVGVVSRHEVLSPLSRYLPQRWVDHLWIMTDPHFIANNEYEIRRRDFYEALRPHIATPGVDEDDRPLSEQPYVMALTDYRRWDWTPNMDTQFMNARLKTNNWGMIGPDVKVAKRKGLRRIAVLGGSNAMSYGVDTGMEWPRIAEQKLKAEFLNFSVVSYNSSLFPYVFEKKVAEFHPDTVILGGSLRDLYVIGRTTAMALREGLHIPYGELAPLLGLKNTEGFLARHYFREPPEEVTMALFRWGLQKMAVLLKQHGADPVYVMLPSLSLRNEDRLRQDQEIEEMMMSFAKECGFQVIDLREAFLGREQKDVTLMDDPYEYSHYNVLGHQLIGNMFAERFTKNK